MDGRGRLSAATGSALALVALTVIAAMAAGISAASTRSDERDADQDAARAAADRFASSLTAVTSAVAGLDTLGLDGIVDAREFSTFAGDVATTAGLPALAYVELVPDADRTAWETETGSVMQDTDGAGGFKPAASRPMHAVVRYIAPLLDSNRGVLGFDLMSDPTRAQGIAAARNDPGAHLVGPISTVTGAVPGLFLTAAIHDPDGNPVGFIAGGFSLDPAADRLDALSVIRSVAVSLEGQPLLERGHGDATETFTLAGRTFTVSADAPGSANWAVPALLALASLLFGVAAVRAVRRERRERAGQQRASERATMLAGFAEHLVGTTTTRSSAQLAADHAGRIVGAAHTNVGIRDPSDPSKLRVVHDSGMAGELADRFALQAVSDDLPLAEAARTGTTIWIRNQSEYAARYPHVIDDVTAAGIHAVCCVPLSLGTDTTAGVIGFAFDHPLTPAHQAEIESAATVISQMTGRALDRARVRELVQERVDLLADLARELTTVRATDEVTAAVTRMVPPLLDLESAELSDTPPPPGPTAHVYTPASDGTHLVLHHSARRAWASIDDTLAATIADLVGGALTRTRLHDQERAVLRRLQASLLMPAPDIDGFAIGVGYRSALDAIGMGGDWYSIIDAPDAIYAVIGDVAGHGPGAVALMAEVKTVMRHLLHAGTPIDQAVTHADHTLQRRNAYASMIVARIDKHTPHLDYINAGHPSALIHTTDGRVRPLGQTHRPWLGVEPHEPPVATRVTFEPGDLLLMYTDGLVEQRNEPLDHSIQRLHHLDRDQPVAALVDQLLANRQHERNDATVDDDVAIVAVQRHR